MKKKLLIALVTNLMVFSMGSVLAETTTTNNDPITFDGNITFHYRDQHDGNYVNGRPSQTRTAFKSTLQLNTNIRITSNLSAYARFSYQHINKEDAAFARDYFDKSISDLNDAAIDSFGLKYTNKNYNVVLGSQALTLGGRLLYDNGFMGRYILPYAVNVTKKMGSGNITAIAAQTNYQSGKNNDKFFVLQGNYHLNPKTDLGTMVAHVNYGGTTKADFNIPDSSVTFFSVYGSKKLTNTLNLSAEYLIGSTSSDNQAFQTNLGYQVDKKNRLMAGYYYVEDQANIFDDNGGDMTGAANNNTKGLVFAWIHKFDDKTSLTIGDLNYKKINSNSFSQCVSDDRNRFFTNLSIHF
ncbi:hypothetical protein [Megasphaera sueciensis]|jgi:hypothetical protein|uniref:hypothetical protein n=1 Tax=Megasphaera sueciensis TaxID=349094 RepID=UPI003D04EEAB